MRSQVLIGAFSLALLLVFCPMAFNPAVAEDKPAAKAESSPAVWIYDVRLVRVDPAAAEGAEKAGPFAKANGTTTSASWPEALAALKNRGQTTLLMDQRVTALEGTKAEAKMVRSLPVLAAAFQDKANRQLRSARLQTGCNAALTTTGASFFYDVEVKLALHPPTDDMGAPEMTTRWSGSHTTLSGKTLVLHSREQILSADGKSQRAVELYALITGRLLGQ
jgi:hypothetical protein